MARTHNFRSRKKIRFRKPRHIISQCKTNIRNGNSNPHTQSNDSLNRDNGTCFIVRHIQIGDHNVTKIGSSLKTPLCSHRRKAHFKIHQSENMSIQNIIQFGNGNRLYTFQGPRKCRKLAIFVSVGNCVLLVQLSTDGDVCICEQRGLNNSMVVHPARKSPLYLVHLTVTGAKRQEGNGTLTDLVMTIVGRRTIYPDHAMKLKGYVKGRWRLTGQWTHLLCSRVTSSKCGKTFTSNGSKVSRYLKSSFQKKELLLSMS